MWGKKNEDEFFWQGNNVVLASRRPGQEPLGHHRARLGRRTFVKGWVVAFGFWSLVSITFALIDSLTSTASWVLSLWAIMLMGSFFVAVLVGTPLALLVEYVLRPVDRQWIHVLVFGVSFCAFGIAIAFLVSPGTLGGFHLALGGIVGAAAGIGRFSIRRDDPIFDAVTTPNLDPKN
ncbi:hypothetical protein [Arthrobacter alpinus]|uniref:hypothetical protein n=1 Tax=Arthrobacter alpinus TaxID=656366 RepID=UPI0012FE8D21|nr:hypothetical protein [Arthrobacter alpinus]